MSERPYIVGNWKMHGTRSMLSEARAIDRAAAPARGGVPVTGPVAGEEVAPAQQAPAQAPASDDPLAGVAQ